MLIVVGLIMIRDWMVYGSGVCNCIARFVDNQVPPPGIYTGICLVTVAALLLAVKLLLLLGEEDL